MATLRGTLHSTESNEPRHPTPRPIASESISNLRREHGNKRASGSRSSIATTHLIKTFAEHLFELFLFLVKLRFLFRNILALQYCLCDLERLRDEHGSVCEESMIGKVFDRVADGWCLEKFGRVVVEIGYQ